MRLKLNRTLRAALIAAITAVGMSISQAATTYVWTGNAGSNLWTAPGNWDLNNGYYPQSDGDHAVINDGTSTVTWSNTDYLGATNTITLGNGNTVLCEVGSASKDLKVSTYTLQGDAEFIASGTNAIGLGRDFTVKYENMTEDAYGLFKIQMSSGTLWGNGHKISLLGEFDTTGITESGEITIFDISDVRSTAGAITIDTMGLTYTEQTGVDVEFVKTNNKVVVRYSVTAPVSSLIWVGAEGNNELTTAVWKDDQGREASYSATSPLVFDEEGYKTVAINTAATAKSMEVQGSGYKFEMGDGASLAMKTLTIAQGASLSITGTGAVTLSGALTKNGELSLASGVSMTAASSSVDANGKFALAGGGHLTLESLNMGSGATQTLAVSDNSRLTVGGTSEVGSGKTLSIEGEGLVDLTTLKSTGGTINVSSNLNVTGGGTGQGGDNQKALAITGGTGTVNINAGTTTVTGAVYSGGGSKGTLNVGTDGKEAKLVATRLEFGDTDSGGSVSRINIGANGTVVVTSNNNEANVKTAGLAVAEWNQNTEISVDGKLYAQSTRIFAHDGLMTLNIQNGGTVAVKGITADKAQNNVVTLAEGGKLVLGDTGITSGQGTWNITLNGGEVGITADTTIARAITVAGAVTFNTDKYTWSDEGQTLTLGDDAGTITVSGNITGAGTITKAGGGTLNLTGGTNVINNTINLQAGTLNMTGAYDISGIASSSAPSYVNGDSPYIAEGNGFKRTEGKVHVVNITGGNLSAATATFTYGSEQGTGLGEDGYFTLSGSTDYSVLYVNNNDGVSYNAAWDVAQAQSTNITSVVMADGTTALTADKEGASFALAIAGTGTVNATAATTVTALTGSGKLIVDGSETVAVQSISGYSGAYEVAEGATLQIATTSLPDKLEVEGPGKLRLITDKQGTTDAQKNITLNEVVAQNLYLGAVGAETDGYNSRFMVKGSTKLDNVDHLYFDGAQLWLDQASLTYSGAVTFLTTTYYENNAFGNAAMRVHHDGTFSGAVDVQDTAKLTWGVSGKTIEFSGTLEGSGNIELRSFSDNTGTFRISGGTSDYEGAILSDAPITLALADNKVLTINSGSDIKGAVTLGTGSGLTVAGEGDSSISGVISGAGSLIKDGEGTLTLSGANTYTGDTVVNGGTLDIQGSISEQSTVKVAQDATLTGNTGDIKVGIAAGKTATIKGEDGLSPKDSGVVFQSDDETVTIENTGNQEITYSINEENAKVTADELVYMGAAADTVVANQVAVNSVQNMDYYDGSKLTLTHVDTEALQSVDAFMGDITLQNVNADPVVLENLSLFGTTVAVYQGTEDVAAQEGKVTITDTLTAGGGTLLANLEMADGSTLDISLVGGGVQALTLGSEFTIADGALVKLDEATLAAIAGLENIGDTVILIKQLEGSELTTNLVDGDWSRTHFDLSSITGADYQLFVQDGQIGLVKSSMVPEPTTGTLSLLALAALAARRRRK